MTTLSEHFDSVAQFYEHLREKEKKNGVMTGKELNFMRLAAKARIAQTYYKKR